MDFLFTAPYNQLETCDGTWLTYDTLGSTPAGVAQTLVLVEEEAAYTLAVLPTLVPVDVIDATHVIFAPTPALRVGVLSDTTHVEVVQLQEVTTVVATT